MDVKKQSFDIKKITIQRLAITVGALSLACLLQGCSRCGGDEMPTDSTVETFVQTQSPTVETTDPTAALRTYYESLIADLRQELLDEREDRYISDFEYQNRLQALEETIASLEDALAQDVPVGGEPSTETQVPLETEGETEAPIVREYSYRVLNKQAYITGYHGGHSVVNVPNEIDGYVVVGIDDQAFQNTSVRSVILPATVREIGWFAFGGCYELELVSIPASVQKINYGAFDGCPHLTILCPADSYAAAYAVSFGLPHQYV